MADDDQAPVQPAPVTQSDSWLDNLDASVARLSGQMEKLIAGIEELLTDSRRARPFLDKYERMMHMPWAKGKK